MEIAIIALIGIFLKFLFGKKETSETPEEKAARIARENELRAYKALGNNPNPNQEDLIQTIFSMAEKDGGLWWVSFEENHAYIHTKAGAHRFIAYSQLGYGKLDFYKVITFENHRYNEFPYRLKRAAESRSYRYWTTRKSVFVRGSTYSTYDEGNSYSRNDTAGEIISSVNVCSQEYYRINKPYPDPNSPPLKKL